jgi:hypothetical protein
MTLRFEQNVFASTIFNMQFKRSPLIALALVSLTACSNSQSSPRSTYSQTPVSLQNATPAVNSAAVNWTNAANALLNSSNVNENNSSTTNIMLISSLRESIAEAAQNATTHQLGGIRDYGAPFLFEYVSAYDQVLSGLMYNNQNQVATAVGKLGYLDAKRSKVWRCVSTDGLDC